MTFDKQNYEDRKMAEFRRVCEHALAIPEFAIAIEERRAIQLTCPRGHRLTTVEISSDPDDVPWIEIRAIANTGRKVGAVAKKDSPFIGAWNVCDAPRCPTRIPYAGRCEEHGGREAIVIDHIATRFTCRSCTPTWSDRVVTSQLIRSLAAALLLGHPAASVTGRVASTRRRAVR